MKILEQGHFHWNADITCDNPHCEARLQIDDTDVHFIEERYVDNRFVVDCPVCKTEIDVRHCLPEWVKEKAKDLFNEDD